MSNELNKIYQNDFAKVHQIIVNAKSQAWQQVNRTLIELYWNIGHYVSEKVENDSWGKSVVEQLSKYIASENPSIKGFSARNIWRMKQFFETYHDHKNLSALLTEISWTNHLSLDTINEENLTIS